MKRILFVGLGALLFLAGLGLAPVISQDMTDDDCNGGRGGEHACGGEEAPEDPWKKLHAPGDPHKLLAKMAGDWELEFKMWQMGIEDPVLTTSMKSTTEMIYGGRFVTGAYEMSEGPYPHTGHTTMGYSATKQKYQWMRMTDMDTNMRVYEGDYDADKKQLTLHAEYTMNFGGQVIEVKERDVYTWESDDKYTMVVYSHYAGFPDMPDEGVKEVEITYTRAKPAAPATKDPNGVLELLRGDFDVEFSIWFEPGADPIEMKSEMSYDWTLDGQHLISKYETDMEAMPHKGVEYISYNEGTGEYESIRLTSMSGALMVWKGKYDTDKKTLEFSASFNMKQGDKTVKGVSRAVYAWVSDDKYIANMYSKYEGSDEEVHEVAMTFTRK